jgi:hypothetical protein
MRLIGRVIACSLSIAHLQLQQFMPLSALAPLLPDDHWNSVLLIHSLLLLSFSHVFLSVVHTRRTIIMAALHLCITRAMVSTQSTEKCPWNCLFFPHYYRVSPSHHFSLFPLLRFLAASDCRLEIYRNTGKMLPQSILSAICFFFGVASAKPHPTVYLIRHAEKPANPQDHGLTPDGTKRAQCLRQVFGAGSGYDIGHIMAPRVKPGRLITSIRGQQYNINLHCS